MSDRICEIDGCDRALYCKRMCSKHYQRMAATGSTEVGTWRKPTGERFWPKVAKADGCWEWQGARCYKGYGQFFMQGRSMVRAHRVAYELAIGPIPTGMQIDHACLNRACVRPTHLRLATPKQNCENLSAGRANNTSGIRGVSWNKQQGKWSASVGHHGQAFHLGFYEAIEDAEAAVVAKRLELFTHNELDRRAS